MTQVFKSHPKRLGRSLSLWHGTRHKFEFLRSGSWVASSCEEACKHLLLKNIEEKREDIREGYILRIPLHSTIMLSDFTFTDDAGSEFIATINKSLGIKKRWINTLESYIVTFPPSLKAFFHPSQIIDLKPLLGKD